MKNNILTVFIFFSFLNGYSVFGHLYDAHSSAMGFAYASNIQNNKYNFLNPASNQLSNDFPGFVTNPRGVGLFCAFDLEWSTLWI